MHYYTKIYLKMLLVSCVGSLGLSIVGAQAVPGKLVALIGPISPTDPTGLRLVAPVAPVSPFAILISTFFFKFVVIYLVGRE
jgi:hypothetical protein